MNNQLVVFISSIMDPQKDDLLEERKAAKEAIESINITKSWRFEDSPASSERVELSYLNKVQESDIFLIILGQEITSPVEKEYAAAKENNKPRLVFLKKADVRSGELQKFVSGIDVKYAEFENTIDLKLQINSALSDELISGYRNFNISYEDKIKLGDLKANINSGGGDVVVGSGCIDKHVDRSIKIESDAQHNVNIQGNVEQSFISTGDKNIFVVNYTTYLNGKESTVPFHVPNSLPDIKGWYGREKEIEELYDTIHERKTKVLGIIGQGGIGKSSLIAKLLEELANRNEQLEAISWHSLRYAPNFDSVINDIIINVSIEITQENISSAKTEQKIDLLMQLLNQKRCLVVLDNLETLFQTDSNGKVGKFKDLNYYMLFKALSELSHQSQIILTSRERPTDISKKAQDFYQYPPNGLSGIDTASAIKLLESQGLVGTDGEFEAIAENYHGHPLALILLSGLINEDYEGKVGRFNSENLVIEGIDELLEEQFKRLSDQEKKLLQQISVFMETITFEAVIAISENKSNEEIREITKKLRRRSLLEYKYENEVGSYELHPMVKEYAYNSLNEKVTTHRRAYKHYLSYELKPMEQVSKISEIKNVLEAFHHACSSGDYDNAYEIILNYKLDYFLALWGNSKLAIELYKNLLPEDIENGKMKLGLLENHLAVMGNLGLAYNLVGEPEKGIDYLLISADKYLENSTDRLLEEGVKYNILTVLGNLGSVLIELEEGDKAMFYFNEAIKISREIEDKQSEGVWLSGIANAYDMIGEIGIAISCTEQALNLARESGDKRNEGGCLGSLGRFYDIRRKDAQRAKLYYEQALDIARELGDKRNEGGWLGNLGCVYQELEDSEKAISCFKQAISISKQIGNKRSEYMWLVKLADLYTSLGDLEQAASVTEQASKIYNESQK